jgi:hypothetical protein
LHCSITSLGLLMMNSGEPMTGKRQVLQTGGRDMATTFRKMAGLWEKRLQLS